LSYHRARMNRILSTAMIFGIMFVPLIAACAGMGAGFRSASKKVAGDVGPAALAGGGVASDTFLAVTGSFELAAEDRLPLDGNTELVATGGKIYDVEGLRDVVIYCKDAECAPLRAHGPVRVEGRLCDNNSSLFGCTVPDSIGFYLTAEEKRRGLAKRKLRVLVVGETPSSILWESWFGFGLSGVFVLVYAAAVGVVVTQRRKTPPISRDLVLNVMAPPTEIRGMIERALAGVDGFRLEHADADRLVFSQGRTESQIRLRGMGTPDAVPRRTTISWSARPYHATEVRVRIEDTVTWFSQVKLMAPLFEAALARTAEQLGNVFRM